jgi:hypothetical protein
MQVDLDVIDKFRLFYSEFDGSKEMLLMSKGLINPSYVTKKIEFKDVISYFEIGDFHKNKTMISL